MPRRRKSVQQDACVRRFERSFDGLVCSVQQALKDVPLKARAAFEESFDVLLAAELVVAHHALQDAKHFSQAVHCCLDLLLLAQIAAALE